MTGVATPTVQRAIDPHRGPHFCVERRVPTGAVRLLLSGALGVGSVPSLRAALRRASRHAGDGLVVVDFAAVTSVAPAAIEALCEAEAEHRAKRGRTVGLQVTALVDATLRRADPDGTLEILDPLDPVPANGRAPTETTTPSIVSVHGTVSAWTVASVEQAVLVAHEDGLGAVALELGAAAVPAGAVTVRLCALLRRLAAEDVPLAVRGAPPAVALVLEICADEILDRGLPSGSGRP